MLRRLYEKEFLLPWRAWLEAVILSVFVLVLFRFINPNNPFLIHGVFPWLLIVPIYIALQYRIGPTLLSLAIIFGAFYVHYGAQTFSDQYNRVFVIIGVVFVLACNQIGSIWILRIRRAEQTAFYITQRLRHLTNDFYTLAFSHSRLEQSIILKQSSLREAIVNIRKLVIGNDGVLNKEISTQLINLLATNFLFTHAQLYLFQNGKIDTKPISSLGESQTLNVEDKLIDLALKNKNSYYYSVNQLDASDETDYLAAIPFITTSKKMLGLLVIEEIPFLNLTEENLTMLSVVLKFFADEFSDINISEPIMKRFPDCPPKFAHDLVVMQNMYQDLKIESSITALYVADVEEIDEITRFLACNIRALDQVWLITTDNPEATNILLILLPFTSSEGALAYSKRINKALTENFEIDAEKQPVEFKFTRIRNNNLKRSITDLVGAYVD